MGCIKDCNCEHWTNIYENTLLCDHGAKIHRHTMHSTILYEPVATHGHKPSE